MFRNNGTLSLVAAAALAGFTWVQSAPADAVVICQNKKGSKVKLRPAACKSKETLLFEVTESTDVSALEARMTAAEGEIGGLHSSVGGIQTDVSGIQGDVSDIQADVGGIQTDVGGIDVDLDALETQLADATFHVVTGVGPPGNEPQIEEIPGKTFCAVQYVHFQVSTGAGSTFNRWCRVILNDTTGEWETQARVAENEQYSCGAVCF